jgi:hypothetical protein
MALAPHLGSFASVAAVTAAFPPTSSPIGALAYTADQQTVQNNGTSWIPTSNLALCPPAAVAAGYTTLTFGPQLVLNNNWYPFNFFSSATPANQLIQNSDGSIMIPGAPSGNAYGGGICTCKHNAGAPNLFNGIAFGGGGYFECTMSFLGAGGTQVTGNSPAFWANDIEHMSGGISSQWPGQAGGYNHWIEVDIMELDSHALNSYGVQIHDDYGANLHVEAVSGIPIVPLAVASDWSAPHRYGFLWIPATAGPTNGTGTFYFDGVPVSNPVSWALNNDAGAGPPPSGTQIGSILDARHLALIVGTELGLVTSASQDTGSGLFATATNAFVAGQIVYIRNTSGVPTGFTANVPYVVLASGLTNAACKLAASYGGAAIVPSVSAACVLSFSDKPLRVDSVCVWQATTANNLYA